MTATRHMLIFGLGYSGRAIANRLLADGWQVTGTTRSAQKAAELTAKGVTPLIWPGDDAAAGAAIAGATHLLISVPAGAGGDPVLAAHADAIGAHAATLDWAGYLSTTAVYGDRQGGWVDETSDCLPSSERGQWRLDAERAWQALAGATGLPLHIFRLAGIYGPGRGPFAKLRSGASRRIVKPGQVFGRIHVEDIAAAIAASTARPQPGAIYNLVDDLTVPPQEVILHAAELLGLEPPAEEDFDSAEMSPMARSFYGESKRVSAARTKAALGIAWRYPSYREGLAALLEGERSAERSGSK